MTLGSEENRIWGIMTIECGTLDDLRAINAISRRGMPDVCVGCVRNQLPDCCKLVLKLEEMDRKAMNRILKESDKDGPIAY